MPGGAGADAGPTLTDQTWSSPRSDLVEPPGQTLSSPLLIIRPTVSYLAVSFCLM